MKKLLAYLILLAVVNSCKTDYAITEKKSGFTEIKNQETDAEIEKLIQPYRDSISKEMEVVIGTSEMEMKTGQPESLLGNFVCDLILQFDNSVYKPEDYPDFPTIVLMNYRGLRAPLPIGDIKIKNLFEIMPFENAIVYVHMNGKDILAMSQFLVDYGGQPVSSNYRIIVESDKSFSATIDGNPIDTSATYTVISTDYLVNGGDNMSFFSKAKPIIESNYKLRDLLIDQIKLNTELKTLNTSSLDGRITFK